MYEKEKIRQTSAALSEKQSGKGTPSSLLGSLFSWGGNSPKPSPTKKLTVKDELKKILCVIDEEKTGPDDVIVQTTCSLEIKNGKVKLYQSDSPAGKETVEFKYFGLAVDYTNKQGEHRLKLKVKSIELISMGQHHEVTTFMKISDPANEYLNLGLSYIRRGTDNYLSATLDAV